MAKQHEVLVPDIGEFDEVDVIEVLVAVGDVVAVEQSSVLLKVAEKDDSEVKKTPTWSGLVPLAIRSFSRDIRQS